MGKSFILKGQRGGTAGFLQQGGGVLRCKARCDEQKRGKLTLCFEEGDSRELELELDGSESEWPDDGRRRIVCAYVSAEEELLLATDERGKRAFERDRNRARREAMRLSEPPRENPARRRDHPPERSQPNTYEEVTARTDHAKEEKDAGSETVTVRSTPQQSATWASRTLPEGRWPPPPCQPTARYQNGKWVDENGQTEESRTQF